MAARNLVVVGGSYVGVNVAQQLAARFFHDLRVVLIEKNSHFNHLFAFPRFAATAKVETQKAFIPYTPGTFASSPAGAGTVVQAAATALTADAVQLDREVSLDGQLLDSIPYAFLVIVTGTRMVPPSSMPGTEKKDGVAYLRHHAAQVEKSARIAIIGGGAVGVQMATDIKELYPDKAVTLLHSRSTVMNRFHVDLDRIVKDRFAELGVATKLGSRVTFPREGKHSADGQLFDVECADGTKIPADLAIVCTGQAPQSGLLKTLAPGVVNDKGFIRVRDTLQIDDAAHPNVFAIGDIADTAAAKAARPAARQATLVVQNIQHLLNKEPLDPYEGIEPAAIHMTLGITKNIVFCNPPPGSNEPTVMHRVDGNLNMSIDGVWTRRGGGIDANL